MPASTGKGDPGRPSRRATIGDVAKHAGVSQGLVSRLLNNDSAVRARPETRRAVLQAAQELDYVANSSAASLRRGRTNLIGLALEHVTNPIFTDVVHGARQAAADFGYGLLIVEAEDAAGESSFLDEVVKARRVDGLLLQGGFGATAETLRRHAAAIPSVMVNSSGSEFATGVSLEDGLATRMATEHLLALGHRELVFVSGPPSTATQLRRRGFEEAFEGVGLSVDAQQVVSGAGPFGDVIGTGNDAVSGYEAVKRTLADNPHVTGFVMGLAVPAIGALSALAELGLRVPDDVSVVAVHDPWFARFLVPSVTAVALPLHELGRQSVIALMDRLDGAQPNDITITDPAPMLVVRASSGPPRPRPAVGSRRSRNRDRQDGGGREQSRDREPTEGG